MPVGETAVLPLGRQVLSLLLTSLMWVALLAVVVGAVCWYLARRRGTVGRSVDGPVGRITDGDLSEPRARRFVRVAFGLLWIVDGLLQAQPNMPGQFVAGVVQPAVSGGPGWLTGLAGPLARGWTRHPVAADVATIWIQVGLGLLLLIGGRGLLSRCAAWIALGWSLVVWVVGEGLGGLWHSGASWLSGAPGAVAVYAVAAGLLLLPGSAWSTGRAQTITRRVVAGWLALDALLQALPAEGMWTSAGAAAPFVAGSGNSQPAPFADPITRLASIATAHPAVVNATVIGALVAGAVALWRRGSTRTIAGVLVLCGLTWWLAQDFGVLGGMGTDPNSALALGLLLASALPAWSAAPRPVAQDSATPPVGRAARSGLRGGLAALALGLTLVAPAAQLVTLAGPADANALAVDSNGGVRRIPDRAAVPFDLVDQHGARVTMASLAGKLVVLTFLDPVCTTDCPLVANQLAIADRRLGSLAGQVEFLAVDTNPVFRFTADVAAFTQSHGLGQLPNWHFLTGAPNVVGDLLAAYGVSVGVPTVGMIEHSEGLYFITPNGRQAAFLDDRAGELLTTTYATRVRDEIRTLLR